MSYAALTFYASALLSGGCLGGGIVGLIMGSKRTTVAFLVAAALAFAWQWIGYAMGVRT